MEIYIFLIDLNHSLLLTYTLKDDKIMPASQRNALDRGIAQLVEQWSPKPRAEGSNPSAPAKEIIRNGRKSWAYADFRPFYCRPELD